MTPDEQITRLENRVERLEDQYRLDVAAIRSDIASLVTAVNSALVQSAKKQECPAPGSCIGLTSKLESLTIAHNATMLRVERLELRILDIEKWQGRTIGGLAVLITSLTLFAPAIRKIFNLE